MLTIIFVITFCACTNICNNFQILCYWNFKLLTFNVFKVMSKIIWKSNRNTKNKLQVMEYAIQNLFILENINY